MTTALKRTGAALLTLLMFCMLTLGASAAANTPRWGQILEGKLRQGIHGQLRH